MSKHPLSQEPEWYFTQYPVQIHAPIYRVPDAGSKAKRGIFAIDAYSTCREGLMNQIRRQISDSCGEVESRTRGGWKKDWAPKASVDIEHPTLRQPGKSFIAVDSSHITANHLIKTGGPSQRNWGAPKRATNVEIQAYLDICDAVIGPITVLMNPDRYQGNWWSSTPGESREDKKHLGQTKKMLRWYGVDNTCIAHPALASLYSGLARQCACMARTNMVDQVREDVEGLGLKECLTTSELDLALIIVKKMRRWIEVPVPKGGLQSNVPVRLGSFSKIPALHKAIYTHGFGKTFGATFLEGWAAGSMYGGSGDHGKAYSGIHDFMNRTTGVGTNNARINRLAKSKAA
jgi:hypothetical protein